MKGKFYGVSVGPGDPELITIKAVKTIESCPVIAAPKTPGGSTLALDIASSAVDLRGKTVITPEFAMSGDREKTRKSHLLAAEEICSYLERELDVAMVNLGDVSVYSTFSHMEELVRERGFASERIAGVTSFCAAAAAAGINLTKGGLPLHILPWRYAPRYAEEEGMKVIMKPGDVGSVKRAFAGRGAVAVSNCGLGNEKIERLEEVGDCGYFTLVISE